MIQRCYNSKHVAYAQYGGRGVGVCDSWREDFWAFADYLAGHLGDRPRGKTLDRIDSAGSYEPGNVRWATPREQMQNRTVYGRTPADRRKLDEAVAALWGNGQRSWPRIADQLDVTIWQVRRSLNRLGLHAR